MCTGAWVGAGATVSAGAWIRTWVRACAMASASSGAWVGAGAMTAAMAEAWVGASVGVAAEAMIGARVMAWGTEGVFHSSLSTGTLQEILIVTHRLISPSNRATFETEMPGLERVSSLPFKTGR
jgi:hypothetical protein